MIQRGNQTTQKNGRSRQNGVPFLTIENLSFEKQTATILGARLQDDSFKPNGPQVVVVKILLRSNTYLWTLRQNNPNLDVLCDHIGPDESAWEGKKVDMFVEEDSFDGRKWMRVEVPQTVGKKTK